jgi:hypothetical protein
MTHRHGSRRIHQAYANAILPRVGLAARSPLVSEYDSPWKEAIEWFLQRFLEFTVLRRNDRCHT